MNLLKEKNVEFIESLLATEDYSQQNTIRIVREENQY
jgi:hypothetical protein